MTLKRHFTAGLPHLDVVTSQEDTALALELHWTLLADSLGLPPSRWYDSQGDRMYAAAVHLTAGINLDHPVREDDRVSQHTALTAIRKPHALSQTRFDVAGTARPPVKLLTSFMKRSAAGSNKKFVQVRDL
jgi:probable biosynthetic protein (TIGR04098 family)